MFSKSTNGYLQVSDQIGSDRIVSVVYGRQMDRKLQGSVLLYTREERDASDTLDTVQCSAVLTL